MKRKRCLVVLVLILAFSDDSRTLITTGRYATATWDVEDLVRRALAQ
ncbi:MAG: hypothetical protein GYB65_23305 [Chloroflexi bacterium]|nr:hypothetical protein [Chloroflexota bacterium]